MAASTQKDASISPEVIAAIMAWIVDTRLYLFYDRELQHFDKYFVRNELNRP